MNLLNVMKLKDGYSHIVPFSHSPAIEPQSVIAGRAEIYILRCLSVFIYASSLCSNAQNYPFEL